jgi:DNA topoisomerase-1
VKRKLLIVESPAKIKTISKFLGDDFNIVSTMGHIKDLPTNKLGITINGTIDIDYVTIDGKESTIAKLAKAASNADIIYLAPDPDREGEIIAWHAQQELKKVIKKNTELYRISFNEITKEAILNALEHTALVDADKVAAQQARRILDRWVGYEVSPILWKKLGPGLSAGRVQSVALRMVCEREEAIRAFKPEEYWSIAGIFGYNNNSIEAALTTIGTQKAEIKNKKEADGIIKNLQSIQSFSIEKITDKKRSKNPYPPFMTSTLQQASFNKIGFSVQKTMQIAQQLYEGVALDDPKSPVALITYMRTDSLRIADSALVQVRDFIKKEYSSAYMPDKSVIYEKKSKSKAQDAHEAIRPINVNITPHMVNAYLSKDQAKLYELIWSRFVSCQMNPAEYAQRQVAIKGGKYTFKVTGSTLIFDGFLKAYNTAEDDTTESDNEEKTQLPADLKEKSSLSLSKIDPKQHFTQPPAKYTEATIVKELEKDGIGRPSTYATILNTIKARKYVTIDKKKFTPTELGMAVTRMLVENLADIMNAKFTAHMEENLDKIANGELDRDTLLRSFYQTFQKDLAAFAGKDIKKVIEPTEIDCPECKAHKLAIRFGRSGEFLGCLGYPECSFTSNFKRNEQGTIELTKAAEPETLDLICPQCGKALRKIIGKYGPFIACSGYPECTYIHKEKADFSCPLCKGEIVARKWRGGKFWGCSNYPKCNFAVFGEIENEACPQCNLPFLVKKSTKDGTVTLSCWSKECGYQNIN